MKQRGKGRPNCVDAMTLNQSLTPALCGLIEKVNSRIRSVCQIWIISCTCSRETPPFPSPSLIPTPKLSPLAEAVGRDPHCQSFGQQVEKFRFNEMRCEFGTCKGAPFSTLRRLAGPNDYVPFHWPHQRQLNLFLYIVI